MTYLEKIAKKMEKNKPNDPSILRKLAPLGVAIGGLALLRHKNKQSWKGFKDSGGAKFSFSHNKPDWIKPGKPSSQHTRSSYDGFEDQWSRFKDSWSKFKDSWSKFKDGRNTSFSQNIDKYKNILGINSVKTKAEAKAIFKQQALKHHPDRGGSTEKMKEVNEAWDNVKNHDWFKKLASKNFWDLLSGTTLARKGAQQASMGLHKNLRRDQIRGVLDKVRPNSLTESLELGNAKLHFSDIADALKLKFLRGSSRKLNFSDGTHVNTAIFDSMRDKVKKSKRLLDKVTLKTRLARAGVVGGLGGATGLTSYLLNKKTEPKKNKRS